MKRIKRAMTFEEGMAILNNDPEFVANTERREREHQRRVDVARATERPVVDDLAAHGVIVDDVEELADNPDPRAVPVLLRHLRMDYPTDVRQFIAHALCNPAARLAWDTLARAYAEEPASLVKDDLAAALAAAAGPEQLAELTRLLSDAANGDSRVLLLEPLLRSRDPAIGAIIDELAADEHLAPEIQARRKERKAPPASVSGPAPPHAADAKETSIGLDADMFPELIARMVRLFKISAADQQALLALTRDTPIEAEAQLTVTAQHWSRRAQLDVRLFMDDLDAPDLHVFGPRPFIEALERLFADFNADSEAG